MAKWCNVRVDAFAIGMGTQKLWSKTIGETEYSIRIFPIGGFVLLAHEDGIDVGDESWTLGNALFREKNLAKNSYITGWTFYECNWNSWNYYTIAISIWG